MKILIVEDEQSLAEVYTTVFKHSGFDTETAVDGVNALQKMKESKPDFVILDIMMPQMDGIAVFKQMQKDPTLSSVPVAFLSALGKDIADFVGEDREVISKAVAYFQKDQITPAQLVEEVKKHLSPQN